VRTWLKKIDNYWRQIYKGADVIYVSLFLSVI
jgi:hypothetical protein